jgi:hypothetical protein
MDRTEGELQFKPGELRQLFNITDTPCETHDLLICRCTRGHKLTDLVNGKGAAATGREGRHTTVRRTPNASLKIEQLHNWEHFDSLSLLNDPVVSTLAHSEAVTFVFSLLTKTPKDTKEEETIVEEELFAADKGEEGKKETKLCEEEEL